MPDDIPFDKSFNLAPGKVEEVMPGLRRLVANNPGPFTFKGTMTYIVGRGEVAVIDPGPDDARHVAAILDAVRGETERLDAGGDQAFRPDVALADGAVVSGRGFTFEAVATPGHTANHMAFAYKEAQVLLSGDHVMAWSTTVVAPPDGAMSDYMASLEKLGRRNEQIYFPGHGEKVRDAPRFVAACIRHRQGREASILHRLEKGAADIPTIVRAVYIGLDPRLTGAAGLSVLAHLEDLVARGVVATDGPASIAGTYRRVG